MLKQRAAINAEAAASAARRAEIEQQQISMNKVHLKAFREKEHEREKETKDVERKDKGPIANGIQPPGHLSKVKMEQNKVCIFCFQ